MDHFAALRALRTIVDAGSFTAAAEHLGTTHSAMSRQLRQLEDHLQVRLLDRNSRRLSLTEAGRGYYRDAVVLLERLEAADARARAGQAVPAGSVRLSVPQVVASQELPHWLPGFLARYPQVALDLSADDQLVDVVGGGFDLALRIAPSLPDSQLVARELACCERILVAAPGYIARHGLPRQVADLSTHVLLAFRTGGGDASWLLHGPRGAQARADVGQRLRLDATPALHAATLAGVGIAVFTALTVREDLRAGRLIRVLPAWHAGERRYFALYPHARALAPKVRALVEHLAAHYAGQPDTVA
ncbi:LysR family transcriptional regulator [Stenotrophomonas sp. 24(2023)]|uniref:LysR family transcriptional regulator n=1 Tax=Stenotrophomonas sp. 24(2023) TaxID=3068324 RepID=UPI0027DF9A2B|nr:LysR family transcriptional regulator [Stenotrophomonas sp. 24(2023)]WMJ68026.1 LysR family transcriptional regulator [Stenotrophomonas sp. 24(2023)]